MKRFLLGISALLLTTVMGFAQRAVSPASYNGNSGPRLERVAHRRHRQKHYKNHHRRARRHNNHPHA
jgi:hypothetical protein